MKLFPKNPQPYQIRPLEVKGNIEDAASPSIIRQTWRVVFLSILPLFIWAALAPIQEVAHIPGQVVPKGSVQIIQHVDGGVIDQILVQDNQIVEKGQILFRFDGHKAQSELEQVESKLAGLQARAIRAKAFINNQQVDFSPLLPKFKNLVDVQLRIYHDQFQSLSNNLAVAKTQLDRKRSELLELQNAKQNALQQVALTADMVKIRKPLVEQKAISRVIFLETVRSNITAKGEVERYKNEIDNINSAVAEIKDRVKEIKTNAIREANDELAGIINEIAQIQAKRVGLKDQVSQLELRAPVRGIVQELNITSKVVPPGGVLAKVIPLDDLLEINIRIKPEDVGRITINSPVVIKLSSYSFVRFGQLSGKLIEISPSSLLDDTNTPYYRGVVKMEKNYIGDTPGPFPILPGMLAQVDVALDKQKMLDIILTPFSKTLNNAFKEH